MESRLKNVIVFTLKERPLAVELGWIREVFTFGHVTPVPKAPAAIAGVVNLHGSIVSIIDIRGLAPYSERAHAVAGETGLLLEANRVRAALRIGSVDEVASLRPSDTTGHLIDSRERLVELISPKELFASVPRTTLPAWGSGE